MIKIIASDMDGTLLNNRMEVSENNAAAITAAQKAGIDFIVATGRGITEAKPLLDAHDLHTTFITLNGALVIDTDGKEVVKHPLDRDKLHQLVALLRQNDFYFEMITSEGPFSESKIRRIQNVADLLVTLNPDQPYKIAVALAAARLELMNINYIDNFDTILSDPNKEVFKIIAFDKRGQKAFTETRTAIDHLGGLVVTSSSDNNIEINDIQAQKGIALKQYAAVKHIPMTQVMALGDNLNDESMIREAGMGVAMANAVPHIKAIANRTTDFNTKDGVGKAIQWALNGEI
ncbi:Cof-type HAD-IIB family hydrolase [Agrilactobacillus fermenti]|uniref:Cof-type HAD-IIB family hydrolase n=1 Tax=Agrilactobacillus fermenti TaxID=2586909 RepID=UPI001E581EC8|nr:Cof-type HAD-IIB family hydrolase [Agrilactobacillus fermenti]MCD2256882.1 HAD family phosphatase [Agrilactobacillus fermenti]